MTQDSQAESMNKLFTVWKRKTAYKTLFILKQILVLFVVSQRGSAYSARYWVHFYSCYW